MKACDITSNHSVTYSLFYDPMVRVCLNRQDVLNKCHEAFEQFDMDGSGTIEPWELKVTQITGNAYHRCTPLSLSLSLSLPLAFALSLSLSRSRAIAISLSVSRYV